MYNILIVEDEVKIAETVMEYLKRDGHKLQHVTTAAAAMAAIDARTDLIILDLMLPDGQGEHICEWVVSRYDTPVIMLTSKRSEESRITRFAVCADDYLTYLFSPRELPARLRSAMQHVRPQRNVIRQEG